MKGSPARVDPTVELGRMQAILSASLARGGSRYVIHPGDIAWWVYHQDPRTADSVSYWMDDDHGFVVLGESEVAAFSAPGAPVIPLIEWGREQLGPNAEVGWVADSDTELVAHLGSSGAVPGPAMTWFEWDLTQDEAPAPALPDGWALRHVRGEEEADNRRAASHRAFGSTLDPKLHLERYLRFMRSPAYDPSRDLVVVSPQGRIAAFMVWWPDDSGLAQIEPFGTDPDFHRRGLGRALIAHGLSAMRKAGMRRARVCTEESRLDASAFYPSVGFKPVGRLTWWRSGR